MKKILFFKIIFLLLVSGTFAAPHKNFKKRHFKTPKPFTTAQCATTSVFTDCGIYHVTSCCTDCDTFVLVAQNITYGNYVCDSFLYPI